MKSGWRLMLHRGLIDSILLSSVLPDEPRRGMSAGVRLHLVSVLDHQARIYTVVTNLDAVYFSTRRSELPNCSKFFHSF